MNEMHVEKFGPSHLSKHDNGLIKLVSGHEVSMRLWKDEQVSEDKSESQRDYETIGYCIQGRAELLSEGQVLQLGPGDSWVVPKGAPHQYKIIEPFTALEATSPPAEAQSSTPVANETEGSEPATKSEPRQKTTKIPNKNNGAQKGVLSAGKDVAAHIARDNSDVSSNAAIKKRVPSEYLHVEKKQEKPRK
jgi:quercetin dioxygenase-like cupin family protein